jgi:hypothetical protein
MKTTFRSAVWISIIVMAGLGTPAASAPTDGGGQSVKPRNLYLMYPSNVYCAAFEVPVVPSTPEGS